MKGIAFYLEFPSKGIKKRSGKRHTGHCCNVFAGFVGNGWHQDHSGKYLLEGLGAVYDYANSPVAGTSASREFIDSCKRIPEQLARQIHPELFRRLDEPVETASGIAV